MRTEKDSRMPALSPQARKGGGGGRVRIEKKGGIYEISSEELIKQARS